MHFTLPYISITLLYFPDCYTIVYSTYAQFHIEVGGLGQGVIKLITIVLTFVTLNKKYAN